MIAKQLKEPTKQAEDTLRKILHEKADTNSDGFFLRQEDFMLRTIDDRVAKKHIREIPLNNLMLHFRMASSGLVNEDNVHGWDFGDWTFLHNGTIPDLVDYTLRATQAKTDSLKLFEELYDGLLEINPRKDNRVAEVINKVIPKHNFYGRAILYNRATDKLYTFGDFEIYMIGNSHLIISSIRLHFDQMTTNQQHGFVFAAPKTKLIGEGSIDGIGVVHNFHRPGFRYKKLDELKKKVSDFSYANWQRNHSTGGENDDENFTGRKTDTNTDPATDRTAAGPILGLPARHVAPPEQLRDAIRIISSETQEMAENINRAKDMDGIVDLGKLGQGQLSQEDRIDDIEQYDETETQLKDGLYMIQGIHGFIGYDIDSGIELYLDEDGIHQVDGKCHEGRNVFCRTMWDLENIIFNDHTSDGGPVHVSQLLHKYAKSSA